MGSTEEVSKKELVNEEECRDGNNDKIPGQITNNQLHNRNRISESIKVELHIPKNIGKYRLRTPKAKKIRSSITDEDNADTVMYNCRKCPKSFDSQTGLLNHLRMHQTEKCKLTCALCKNEFDTNSQLIQHKKVHIVEGRTFVCTLCELAFSDHYDYLLHNLTHTNSKHHKCLECHKNYYSKQSYHAHLKIHYDKQLKCKYCPKILKSRASLNAHEKIHNTRIECGECGKIFQETLKYKYHMATHTAVKLYQCYYCGIGYANNSSRRVHMRIHTNEKPFECQICKKTFRQYTDMKRHVDGHKNVEKHFECDICHKKFKDELYLKTHKNIHTNTGRFPCTLCNKKLLSMTCLKSHMFYNHMDVRLYKCQICNVDFKVKDGLTRHNLTIKHRNNMYRIEKEKESHEINA